MSVIRLDSPCSPATSAAADPQLRRLRGFYRALSDMNRASVRLNDPRALYETICDIAVTSSGAAMAWVGLQERDLIVPVAWSDSARRIVQGLEIRPPSKDSGDQTCGPTALAVARAAPYICNNYKADDCTKPWRHAPWASPASFKGANGEVFPMEASISRAGSGDSLLMTVRPMSRFI